MKIPNAKKLPSGNWFIQMRLGGKSVPVTAPTERDCVSQARLIKAEYLAGKKFEQKKSLTLGQAIDRYIQSREHILSPSTIRGYRTIQRTRFLPYQYQDVLKINWQKMCNAESKVCSAKTLTNAWRFVCSALRFSGVTPPVISLPQIVPSERPFLTPEQIKVFVAAVHGKTCEIPALLALSSLRRSEINALTWDNVKETHIEVKGAAVLDENNNVIYKRENKNKSSARKVPIMIPELKEALEKERKPHGLVFQGSFSSVYKQINRICKDNDLPQVGVHGLRHSFASLAYHLHVPEKVAMKIGGWSDFATMRRIYTHIADSDVEQYAGYMANFFK